MDRCAPRYKRLEGEGPTLTESASRGSRLISHWLFLGPAPADTDSALLSPLPLGSGPQRPGPASFFPRVYRERGWKGQEARTLKSTPQPGLMGTGEQMSGSFLRRKPESTGYPEGPCSGKLRDNTPFCDPSRSHFPTPCPIWSVHV